MGNVSKSFLGRVWHAAWGGGGGGGGGLSLPKFGLTIYLEYELDMVTDSMIIPVHNGEDCDC